MSLGFGRRHWLLLGIWSWSCPSLLWREDSLRMAAGICRRLMRDCDVIDGRGGKRVTVALVQQKS